MKVSRRNFMKTIGVMTITPTIVLGNYKQEKLSKSDLQKVSQDIKAAVIEKFGKKYNVIEDLAGEMRRHNTKNPNQEFRYFIHCNYSGLGMLNQTGQLEEMQIKYDGDNLNRGYRYIMWVLLPSKLLLIPFSDMLSEVAVGKSVITQKDDIELFAVPEEQCKDRYYTRNYSLVATQNFNVDYSEQGKIVHAHPFNEEDKLNNA